MDFAKFITDESNAASKIKRDTPVMVVMGNPPYNDKSANNGDWIKGLMNDYKQGTGTIFSTHTVSALRRRYLCTAKETPLHCEGIVSALRRHYLCTAETRSFD